MFFIICIIGFVLFLILVLVAFNEAIKQDLKVMKKTNPKEFEYYVKEWKLNPKDFE